MAANPPPPQEPSDDWQAPAEETQPGQWESAEIKPAAKQTQAASNWLQPVADALRGPFGALWEDPRSRPLILVSLLAVVGVCALSCFILSVVLLTNPPLPGPVNTSVVAQATQPLTVSLVVNVNNTPIPASVPVRLTIGNSPFNVTAAQVDAKGELPFDRNASKTAYWIAGTLVNYVVGLPDTQPNRATFNGLQPDDLLLLDTSNGTLRFRVSMTETVKPDEQAAFLAQTTPQLTLFLLGEGGDQRHLIIARYTDEGTPNSLTPIGSPINLGDVRVTALNSRVLPGTSVGLPADRSYFQVNIRVSSLVTRVLDASQFTSVLIDGDGNHYQLNNQGAFAAGGAGWTHGALEPGATLTATAGFEIPAGMPGPRVEWSFTTESDNPYVARVTIPYTAISVQPTLAPTVAPVAEVSLLNVNISPQGNELRIVGTARNLTDKFLPVSLRDVQLTSSGNLIALNSSLPAFPWNITPGDALAFQVTFARPPGGTPAIFTLFGQSFEISGL
ncbi:MAG: hypothetical protein M1434_08990 [Chloroflexi bacterium]|nr:hypothetical protein [Chloroflexota bacterium]MCL5274861.1 hypothetical protein [Chloroflexota bacterium]